MASFNPATETSETFNAGFSNGTGRIVVFNESSLNLILAWDTFSTYCPAWSAVLYCISASTVNISWSVQSSLSTAGSPISQVIVEAYDAGEAITGTYPAPLVRQANIGNALNLMTSSTSLQNDGNAKFTNIIEATVGGDAGSAVVLSNNGDLQLGSLNNAGSLAVNGAAGASFAIAENGNVVTNKPITTPQINFPHGTALAGLSVFSSSVNNAGAFINHGLGVVPRAVLFCETNTSTDSTTFTYDPSTMTATQVKCWSSAGVTPRGFTAIAIA